MRDVLTELKRGYASGRTIGLATVVGTYRSAPRQPGAAMVVAPDGSVAGSVSGGCVEGAVYELAQDVMARREPELVRYGVSDDDAIAVGLTCGGIIDVLVEPIDTGLFPELGKVIEAIEEHRPVAVATVVRGLAPARLMVWPDRTDGSLGSAGLDSAVTDDARGMLEHGATGLRRYGRRGQRRRDEVEVFVHSFAPAPRMLIFGAIDYASAMARMGRLLGYRVTLCDARAVFTTPARFPDVDEVVVDWPHRYLAGTEVDARTVICVLTHDPKFDVPLLEVALRTPAGYIGAMGSRRTHSDRLARLREAGLTDAELSRLASPIGLDIGARTPEETAVSIAAEIVANRWGGSGQPLSATAGRIHGGDDHLPPVSMYDQ
ncbi:MAG: XdhC family protein [Sporichthyaceae bacterium]|nr:XdhC family protein [Sporichthyaceae bacterium]